MKINDRVVVIKEFRVPGTSIAVRSTKRIIYIGTTGKIYLTDADSALVKFNKKEGYIWIPNSHLKLNTMSKQKQVPKRKPVLFIIDEANNKNLEDMDRASSITELESIVNNNCDDLSNVTIMVIYSDGQCKFFSGYEVFRTRYEFDGDL